MKLQKNMNGLILAGGESSRLGSDKSLLIYHQIPQRDYLFNLLKEFCSEVHLSSKPGRNIPANLNPIEDKYDYNSPLNGIITAFETAANVSWLTVPVDMPHVDKNVLSYLISKRDKSSSATCFYDSDHALPEPLLAIWEPSILPALKAFQSTGKRSPRDFLMTQKITLLTSPFPGMHTNINTPTDLDQFKKESS